MLVSASLLLGCGTIKKWTGWGDDKELGEEGLVPPPQEEVQKNPDGTWSFTEEHLNNKKTDWVKWLFLSGFLVSGALLVRHVVVKKKQK